MKTAHPTRPPPALDEDTPALAIEELSVAYGGIRALRGVSLHVDAGEVVALIGANGAGKTTTLRAVMGLAPIGGGAIRYAGQNTGGWSVERRVREGISLVPEGRAIFADMSVRENLDLGAYTHREKATMDETLSDVVALFPRLGERMKQRAGTLSGGEQQMLAIARAMMARPSVLLLDEPSLGIAPILARQIFGSIRSIADSGVPVLVVEQNTRLALSVAKRGYVLKTGEVAMSGSSAALLEDPDVRDAYLGQSHA